MQGTPGASGAVELPGRGVAYDFAAFGAMVALAAVQEWSATDLVWSLWISSLLVGYAFIVVVLFVGNDGAGDHEVSGPGASASKLVGWAAALFTLGFFTVHFLGFHYGHSVFLNQFFPLVDESAGFSSGPDPLWWLAVIAASVERYWPFVAATVISRRADFTRSVREDPDRQSTLFRPYRNVIRMHLLIFVYGGMRAAGMTGWFLYAVLAFYFFPLGAVKRMLGWD